MTPWLTKRIIAIVSACMRVDGTPALVLTEVTLTQEEAVNGVHYSLAEGQLLDAGFEEPFVHFAEDEAPPFLFSAVRRHLEQSGTKNLSVASVLLEES